MSHYESSAAQSLLNDTAEKNPTLKVHKSEAITLSHQLPEKKPFIRRILRHPLLMQYHRLFALVLIANTLVAYTALTENWLLQPLVGPQSMMTMVLINTAIAVLIRQQYVVNLLFWIATRAPLSWPLSVRWSLGKVYHFGGLHSGCALAAGLWVGAYAYALHIQSSQQMILLSNTQSIAIMAILALFFGMLVLAIPGIRNRYHNLFEMSHRFGGWSLLALFWLYTVQDLAQGKPDDALLLTLLSSGSFWLLLLLTFSIVLPWLRLKKVAVEHVKPSSHVTIAGFDYGVTPLIGSSTSLSRRPLLEWHSFANVPSPERSGYRLAISRAGDWTGDFINDVPSHVWVKGIPTAGVGNIDQLFKRVIWIATGSGIGPCLPHLLANKTPSLLVWSTRNARKTYGDALVEEILAAQPDAWIWDTDAQGKPDMLRLAYEAYKTFDAEAVICISNKKLTWQVVQGLEERGVPAFGAIWDS